MVHLTRAFSGRRIAGLGQGDVDAYILTRRGEGVVGATIRRELGTLTKMLRLAYQNGKLLRLPMLRKPKEGPPREGFFEREQYEAVRRRLPDDLGVAVTLAYTYGWRMQSEVLTLERRQLDLEVGTLRLDPGSTKNDEGRIHLPHTREQGAPGGPGGARGGPAASTRPDRAGALPPFGQRRAGGQSAG